MIVKIKIMQDRKAHREHFARLEKMSYIRSRIVSASGARAALLDRGRVSREFCVVEVKYAAVRVKVSMARIAA